MASRLAMLALLLVFAVWGAWPNYVATARVEGTCGQNSRSRRITFLTPVGGFYLEGHVFSNHSVELNLNCQDQCALARECVSYNIGPKINIKMACELSNSDHFQHPEDLKPRKEWIYRGTKNLCASQPCLNNGTCYMGYTVKKYICACPAGFKGENCEIKVRRNCAEVYEAGFRTSGVYTIDPDDAGAFDVYCDQKTAGGGWTVFQKRLDGSVDFYRGWDDYKRGFGNLNGEIWLGLDKIHRLTKGRSRLWVDLEDFDNQTAYAEYDSFGVGDEQSKYKLERLGQYAGTAGDSLAWHRNMPFSTKDQDNDQDPGRSCAIAFEGAWWYNNCHYSNLNGRYLNGNHSSYANGVNWYPWKGYHYSAKRAEMKIKPVEA